MPAPGLKLLVLPRVFGAHDLETEEYRRPDFSNQRKIFRFLSTQSNHRCIIAPILTSPCFNASLSLTVYPCSNLLDLTLKFLSIKTPTHILLPASSDISSSCSSSIWPNPSRCRSVSRHRVYQTVHAVARRKC